MLVAANRLLEPGFCMSKVLFNPEDTMFDETILDYKRVMMMMER